MFLSRWQKALRCDVRPERTRSRRVLSRFFRTLWLKPLEDRTLPSTFHWVGGGSDSNWNTAANWNLLSGAGSFPHSPSDVAQFTGSYSAAQTATLNQGITVGEIEFGSTKNITIAGSSVLTLDNSGTAGNAVLDVGQSNTNSGLDVFTAPVQVATATPLKATVTGGTLQMTSTSNVIGSSVFTVNAGGTLNAGAGTFTVTLKTSGNQTVMVTDPAAIVAGGTSAPIAVSPAAATHFSVSAPSTTTAGVAFTSTVKTLDAFNNTALGYTGLVHFSSGDHQGDLPADSTLSAGTGTFTVTLKTAGSETLNVADTLSSAISGQATVAVTPATPAKIVFSTQPAGTVLIAPYLPAVVVAIEDRFNNVVTADNSDTVTVRLLHNPTHAILTGATRVKVVNGLATFSRLHLNNTGVGFTFLATSPTLGAAVSSAFTVAPVVHFKVTTSSSTSIAGSIVKVTVQVLDSHNHVVPTYTGTVHFASNDPHAVLPKNSKLLRGRRTFSVKLETAGKRSITVSDLNLPIVHGAKTLLVKPAALKTLQLTGFRQSTLVGQVHPLTVAAVDAYGNAVPSYRGTVVFTSTDPQAVLPPSYTFVAADKGKHVFNVTLLSLGIQSLTVADTVHKTLVARDAGIKVSNLVSDIVVPPVGVRGQPVSFTLSAAETGMPAGTPFTFRIDWQDNGSFDRTVVGPSGTVVSHIYPTNSPLGGYKIMVTATDHVGNVAAAIEVLPVQAIAMEADPLDPHKTALVVGGTTGADTIVVRPTNSAGTQLQVLINGVSQGSTWPPPEPPWPPTGERSSASLLDSSSRRSTSAVAGEPPLEGERSPCRPAPSPSRLTGSTCWRGGQPHPQDQRDVFATGGEAGSLLEWKIDRSVNAATRLNSRPLNGHRAAIVALDFDRGQQFLFSGDLDGQVRRWNRSPGNQPLAATGRRGQ